MALDQFWPHTALELETLLFLKLGYEALIIVMRKSSFLFDGIHANQHPMVSLDQAKNQHSSVGGCCNGSILDQ
jgi:hypothetical protein